MAKVVHFAEEKIERGPYGKCKTACGRKVLFRNATGTYSIITCPKCLEKISLLYSGHK
jgi:hypothetical protein